MSLKKRIEVVRTEFRAAIESFPDEPKLIEALRVKFLGRNGQVAQLFERMSQASKSERPVYGKLLNELKNELSTSFQKKIDTLKYATATKSKPNIDYSLPGVAYKIGSKHPIELVTDELKDIFKSVGFSIAYGPEIDDDYHNFSALNFPKHHPARDMQDTFFVDPDTVLRTHTSNVQIHLMENQDPPLRYIVPGRVYRNESISYKSYCLFHQIEGLYVDKHVTFSEMKSILHYFVRQIFGKDIKIRFRPSYFPFTEPSAEVDIWDSDRGQWL